MANALVYVTVWSKAVHGSRIITQVRPYHSQLGYHCPAWVVRMAHDTVGHSGRDETLARVSEAYWFPKMRRYIERFVRCCILCLYTKCEGGKPEGFLNPIPKGTQALGTLHIDHLGPFTKSKRLRNEHVIVVVDGFTKFSFVRAVRSIARLNL